MCLSKLNSLTHSSTILFFRSILLKCSISTYLLFKWVYWKLPEHIVLNVYLDQVIKGSNIYILPPTKRSYSHKSNTTSQSTDSARYAFFFVLSPPLFSFHIVVYKADSVCRSADYCSTNFYIAQNVLITTLSFLATSSMWGYVRFIPHRVELC